MSENKTLWLRRLILNLKYQDFFFRTCKILEMRMRFLRVFWDISLSFGIKPAISGLLIAGLMYLYAEIWKFCGLLIKPKKMKVKVTSVIKTHQLKQILVLEQILERIQRNIRSQFFFFFGFNFGRSGNLLTIIWYPNVSNKFWWSLRTLFRVAFCRYFFGSKSHRQSISLFPRV